MRLEKRPDFSVDRRRLAAGAPMQPSAVAMSFGRYGGGRMPRVSNLSRDIDDCDLSFGQLQELWLGAGHNGSLFSDEQELRAAWTNNRDLVMKLWAHNGKRPMAWWHLGDAASLGLEWPGYDHQQSYLFEHNALSEEECKQLLASWREEFAHACSLEGAAARKAHLDWADVPHSLRQQWRAERRRRRSPVKKDAPGAPFTEGEGGTSSRPEPNAVTETVK
jgi:hypothetical protein